MGSAERLGRGASGLLTLIEEPSDRRLRAFVLDPREQLRSELAYRLGAVERQPVVHLPTREMARLTPRLENGPYVPGELDDAGCLRRRRRRGNQFLPGGLMRTASQEQGDRCRPGEHLEACYRTNGSPGATGGDE